MTTPRTPARHGFTMIELLMVVILVGVMMAIAVPRFRISPETEVQLAGMQLAQDLDLARTRALSTRATARVKFGVAAKTYVGYLDHDYNGAFGETRAETDALRGWGTRTLPARVLFGRGVAGATPGDGGGGAVTLPGNAIDFDTRGLTFPMGASGTVYLRHQNSPTAVVAVQLSPAGNVRLWTWRGGSWQ
jgi:prepilin-type N-terminal cleavage/methylation domain-containing protein